jgi:response regulator RpfG family c-di-GMP phosphodiesterase
VPLAVAGGLLLWLGAGWLLAREGWYLSPLFPTIALVGAVGVAAVHRLIVERARADQSTRQLRTAREMMLHALTSLTETRDFETGAHLVRTSRYARSLGEALASHPKFRDFLTPETIDLIARLAPIHDIGKVGVADRTLRKPGPLSDDERVEMSRHPTYGRDVIVRTEERVGVRDDFLLKLAKEIVYSHHEHWDGSGYPEGLRGEAIPVAGRMVALVDVYDALASARVYKGALPHEEVVQAIIASRGTHFDPDMVDAFLRIQEDWRRIAIDFADEHDDPAAHPRQPATG